MAFVAAAFAATVAAADPVIAASSDLSTIAGVAAASGVTVAASAGIHRSDRSYFVAVAPILGQIPGQMLLTIGVKRV